MVRPGPVGGLGWGSGPGVQGSRLVAAFKCISQLWAALHYDHKWREADPLENALGFIAIAISRGLDGLASF